MKRLHLTIITALFFTTFVFPQKADDILGKYRLPNNLDIEIFQNEGIFYGKIIAIGDFDEGQTTDINNPDASKRDEPLLGMVIIKDLEFDADKKQWVDGKMYGPEKGMVFNLKITGIGKDEIEVVGSKYIFWHTLKWIKI
jgi:uncharacterized protein (DUF2147 family)